STRRGRRRADGWCAEGGAASHTSFRSRPLPRERATSFARLRIAHFNGGPMLGGLDGNLGVGRVVVGNPAVSQSWDRDVAGGFVEELFAKHHGEIYAYTVRLGR